MCGIFRAAMSKTARSCSHVTYDIQQEQRPAILP
jgi:hypothetical protein